MKQSEFTAQSEKRIIHKKNNYSNNFLDQKDNRVRVYRHSERLDYEDMSSSSLRGNTQPRIIRISERRKLESQEESKQMNEVIKEEFENEEDDYYSSKYILIFYFNK